MEEEKGVPGTTRASIIAWVPWRKVLTDQVTQWPAICSLTSLRTQFILVCYLPDSLHYIWIDQVLDSYSCKVKFQIGSIITLKLQHGI